VESGIDDRLVVAGAESRCRARLRHPHLRRLYFENEPLPEGVEPPVIKTVEIAA
jgi:hypothetical protein